MKTEQALSTQQYNVEQSALFPKNALEPETTTGIIEIPDHDPVIFPGIDSAEHFDVTGLSAEKKSEFIETVHVVRNMAREAVYGAQRTGAQDATQRAHTLEAQANRFAAAVTFIGETLPFNQREQLADAALDALKELPRDEVHARLVDDVRTATQTARQRSIELQAERDEISSIEQDLRTRRVALQRELHFLPDDAPLKPRVEAEMAFIDSILERQKKSPKIVDLSTQLAPRTDELEAHLALPSDEMLSPPRGIAIARMMAHRVIDSTVEFAHKAKQVLSLDETKLHELHDTAASDPYATLSNMR